ncbi:ApaG protein [Sphingomonas vulcanisoli]|uniref:Protein ApaG n=1 Tax=Sphingomonas vulcanisoli TaxID=1658060 RepID=A0ABX0TNA7_9SPHN|nr:Co2+/Mg2+ efflux protein ApaG [Sphingomonas vulcanisoli]NIJ07018.1 ApaG protein [Sphingomonas vulcanisoli]
MASGALDIFFPYKAVTQGIVVRVSVSYLEDQSDPRQGRWFWAYHIRIENQGTAPVQLMTRRWIITDAHGNRQRVEGEGVIGEQPVIAPGEAYDYVSGCPLETPSGTMEGAYQMAGSGGGMLEVAIPHFPLSSAETLQ